jgi:hypothetical protein
MQSNSKFRNAILCDDVRDEIGNKKSLMGIIVGDILVTSFPATIQMAVFAEYLPTEEETEVTIGFGIFQDETEIGRVQVRGEIKNKKSPLMVVLPKGFITFDKAATLRATVTANETQEEIITKKVFLNPALSSASSQPASQSQPAA